MRNTILIWSTLAGALLGLFLGVLCLGVAPAVVGLLPAPPTRWAERLRDVVLLICLVVVPIAGAIIGYLEGTLKLK